jgi:hypothetical protein
VIATSEARWIGISHRDRHEADTTASIGWNASAVAIVGARDRCTAWMRRNRACVHQAVERVEVRKSRT